MTFAGQDEYNDCILTHLKEAKLDAAAGMIRNACYENYAGFIRPSEKVRQYNECLLEYLVGDIEDGRLIWTDEAPRLDLEYQRDSIQAVCRNVTPIGAADDVGQSPNAPHVCGAVQIPQGPNGSRWRHRPPPVDLAPRVEPRVKSINPPLDILDEDIGGPQT